MTQEEREKLVERNKRYIASLRGENELKCGNGMASFALEESTDQIEADGQRIAELEAEVEKFSGLAKLAILKAYDTDKFSTQRIAELEAEIDRLKGNVIRNCVNWGPCSEHDGRMVGEAE